MKKIVAMTIIGFTLVVTLAGCGPRAGQVRDRTDSSGQIESSSGAPTATVPGPGGPDSPAAGSPAAVDADLSDVDGLLDAVDSELTAADAQPADAD